MELPPELSSKLEAEQQLWDQRRAEENARTEELMANEPDERPPLPPPALEWGRQECP